MKNKKLLYAIGLLLFALSVFTYAQFGLNSVFKAIDESRNKARTYISHRCHKKHVIPSHLVPRVVTAGDTAAFCERDYDRFITYQWFKDGDSIKGANKCYYAINQSAISDEGKYWCKISDGRNRCLPITGDTVQLKEMPYKGFDPSTLDSIHLWFRDNKGLVIYSNKVPNHMMNSCNETSVCIGDSCLENGQEFEDFTREGKLENHCGYSNPDFNFRDFSDFEQCAHYKNYWYYNVNDNFCAPAPLNKTCIYRRDINLAPSEFTFMMIFNRSEKYCDIFSNSLFKIFCQDSICYISYENGKKDLLDTIGNIANICITKTDSDFVVLLNNEEVKKIAASDFTTYFPSLRCTWLRKNWFCMGSEPLCSGIWEGRVNEFLFYQRALTTNEYEQVRTYLVSKYADGLHDIWHSQWAYAPAFSPSVNKYKAVIPYFIDSLTFDAVEDTTNVFVEINGLILPHKKMITSTTDSVIYNVETSLGTINYQLNIEKSSNYAIYVSSSATGANTGTSWHDAYTDLQKALDDAGTSGKEILVAEGTYIPTKKTDSKDSRSATFLIKQGTEILGAFKSSDTGQTPTGSPYNTILSGDIKGNDNGLSAWPPVPGDSDIIKDNVYHVLVIAGSNSARSINVNGLTITGGIANHKTICSDEIGAGIYNKCTSPTLSKCHITKNFALVNGAGFYNGNSPKDIEYCLFENNAVSNGNGGGLYNCNCKSFTMNACIFCGNSANGVIGNGGGIFNFNSVLSLSNCVFTANFAQNDGGAIYNYKSVCNLTNNTITRNASQLLCGGISSDTTSKVEIINTILWSDIAGSKICSNCNKEIRGSASVTYSCISGGYYGIKNISTNPLFIDSLTPKGTDGLFFTKDDGLQIHQNSPCFDAGFDDSMKEFDVLGNPRPEFEHVDIGAYEFMFIESDNSNFSLGDYWLSKGFVTDPILPIVTNAENEYSINSALAGRMCRVLQIVIPKNKYTDKKNVVYGWVYCIDGNNNPVSDKQTQVYFYRVGSTQQFRSLIYTDSDTHLGKWIVCVTNKKLDGMSHENAYVMLGSLNGKIKVTVPHSQF